jgi:predicted ATP-dependent endonuclease of OLD family
LVVFYTVLFNTRDEILFIDEPENSLHIMWQEKYLNALISAAKEKDVQIVVATHSPFITMGHEPITERITLIHDRLD